MPEQGNAVVIEGLTEFRAALRAAWGRYPVLLAVALKAAGEPFRMRSAELTARRTGRLASGYRISVAGTRGSLVSSVPYAGGAVWGRRGKWSGFSRYGSPPRFAGPALDSSAAQIEELILVGLKDVVEAYGWFHR